MAEIVFTDAAIDDLRRLGPDVVPQVLKKVLILLDDAEAGQPLGGTLTGFRKLVVGRNHWRIMYRIAEGGVLEICEIWCVGARSDAEVYDEASARIAKAVDRNPAVRRLADVVDRLGRLAGGITVADHSHHEPVPDWLAQRLIRTAGLPAEKVAALNLEQAVDLWTAYVSGPSEAARHEAVTAIARTVIDRDAEILDRLAKAGPATDRRRPRGDRTRRTID
ncbi:MAG TPA: type II toxin-antitoxin system RelE/ParE family toxin [Pseudonocardiaceae bacterium]|jgi:mRNA-degrading endonuclease RelE of RelBE toxin-antitoxin system|nr:type II toxin-antitoxin system RelE/ParE family toxin [Pseudonocardiaceae bacterium]